MTVLYSEANIWEKLEQALTPVKFKYRKVLLIFHSRYVKLLSYFYAMALPLKMDCIAA